MMFDFMWIGLCSSLLCACRGETFVCSSLDDSFHNSALTLKRAEERISALEQKVQSLQRLLLNETPSPYITIEGIPRDCEEIYSNGTRVDGVYTISPDGRCPFFVYCDLTNGGWTVIQKRLDGSVNLYRPWEEYVQGFGDLDGEHWLGLEKIHRLTKEGIQIYFNMTMWDDSNEFAHYKVFTVHEAATSYRMNMDNFGYEGTIKEQFSYHDNMKFSTFDRDNDASSASNCCEQLDGGGWWYNSCYRFGNLNGIFGKKVKGGIAYWDTDIIPVKTVNIKVKSMNGTC